ncbi:MAG TPA: hypothetical protein PKC43_11120 [Phycisphaerales bacterium]|nr:hypothetical protein [Phycisphaerales bacterium]HMP37984.1 hypothetical protein [Phycisphaerales bacterium]
MRRAITLVELLVSIAMVLLLLGALFTFVGDLLAARARVRTVGERQAMVSMLIDRIEQDLAMAIVGDPALGAGVAGTSETLTLLTRGVLPGDPDPAAALADMHRHEYRFEADARHATARRSAPRRAPADGSSRRSAEAAIVVAAPLEGLRFRYFDGRTWQDSFDSLQRRALPMAVEVAIWFEGAAEGAAGEELDVAAELGMETALAPDDRLADDAGAAPARRPDRLRVIAIPDARPSEVDAAAPKDAPGDDARPLAAATLRGAALGGHRARRSAVRRSTGRTRARGAAMRRRTARRGFILIAVVVAAAVGALVVLGVLSMVRAESTSAAARERRAQAAALAWSGVQAYAAALDAQRDRILAGELPTLPGQLVIDDGGGSDGRGRIAVARLLPFEAPTGEAALFRAEAGCVDLNRADAAQIAATGLVDLEEAKAIVARRTALGGRLQSELDLLGAPGVPVRRLVGEIDAAAWADVIAGRGANAGGLRARGGVPQTARGLLDVATVHAVEPMLQRSGSPRHRIGQGWSDELAVAIERQFGNDVAVAVKGLVESGALRDEASILAALRVREVPQQAWPDLVDAFTTDPDELHGGRLDLNTARYEALLSLPGVTPTVAAEIVRQRDALPSEDRATPIWPLRRGIVDGAVMEGLAGRATTRSFLWRVRVAAGEVESDDPEGPLSPATVWEAVIDLTTARWRIAHLRDVTLLPAAIALATEELDRDDREFAGGGAAQPAGVSRGADEDPESSARRGPRAAEGPARTEIAGREIAPREGPRRADGPGRRGGERRRGPREGDPGAAAPPPPPQRPPGPAPVGRWRT